MGEIIQREFAIQKIEELAGKQLLKANVNCISVNAGEVIDCISELPSVDEKDITHKVLERIMKRLEELKPDVECFEDEDNYLYATKRHNNYIKIIKEEGGIE